MYRANETKLNQSSRICSTFKTISILTTFDKGQKISKAIYGTYLSHIFNSYKKRTKIDLEVQ